MRKIDWLLAWMPTFAVSVVIALLLGQNIGRSAAIGLAISASSLGAAAILNGRQTARLMLLEQQTAEGERAGKLVAELPNLQAQYQQWSAQSDRLYRLIQEKERELAERHNNVGTVNGQIAALKERARELQEAIAPLVKDKDNLERRVAAIKRSYPDLENLEQLQARIEQSKLEKSTLEGQITALSERLSTLQEGEKELSKLEATAIARQVDLEQANSQLQALQVRAGELAKSSAKLEVVQNSYNELLRQRQNLEEKVNKLDLDRQRLELSIEEKAAEYDRLLENQPQIKDMRRVLHSLRLEQEELEVENRRLKQEAANLQGVVQDPLHSLKQPLWSEADTREPWSSDRANNEQQFLRDFSQYAQQCGFHFPERVILAFHTSLKVQGISALVVLAGISGTGKSELPQLYAKYIGAKFLMLAVQPRWDSPQDLLGFYNYMENQFKPTPLIQGIYQYNRSPRLQNRIAIVLLDEMNLARVEYYFSEFLSKLERRRNHEAYLDIDLGNLPLAEEERHFKIPEQFLFAGTMNEDETTQILSDKVLDRANAIAMPRPTKLELGRVSSTVAATNIALPEGYLTYEQFRAWFQVPDPDSAAVREVEKLLAQTNEVMEEMGHPFAHRVYQAIAQYAVNYPGAEDINSERFRWALADSFAQKILPKLRGIVIGDRQMQQNLDELGAIINAIGDKSLAAAFAKARQGYQFQWKGMSYE
ncbi:MAG: AAA domain-containing protein [Oscillatoria sp. SIO1A7]|nr:AAA domain-containing protein [Oscillatoria sp. SIO1A7]